jgi:tRNA dimethylallyltransferase
MAEFKEMALKKISQIHKRNHLPILVGGTGLYISSIIDSYCVPKVQPDLKLRAKLE